MPSHQNDTRTKIAMTALIIALVVTTIFALLGAYGFWRDEQKLEKVQQQFAGQVADSCDKGFFKNNQGVCENAAKIQDNPGTNDAITGPPGPVGPMGPQGFPGIPGLNGRDGVNGTPGDPGNPGLPGDNGKNGTNGTDGLPGQNGTDGTQGPPGPPGKDGADGKDGAPGADGKDGTNGKDGTAVPGTYTCADGTFVTGITVNQDGTIQLDCAGLLSSSGRHH